jgi:hypothetical protein
MKELDRMATRAVIAASLSSMSSDAMRTLLAGDGTRRVGLGGSTQVIEIAGSSVFVKLLTLTDRELDAGPDDTRNLFGLPPWYQYGVGEGSTGFSAWREIAAHELASEWVVTGAHSAFPLLYHWRVLHPVPQIGSGESDIRRVVQSWEAPRGSKCDCARSRRPTPSQRCFSTGATDGVVDPLAATVRRHAATTALVNDFYFQLHNGHFRAQFPATELAAILPKSSR